MKTPHNYQARLSNHRLEKIYTTYSGFYDLLFDRLFQDSRREAIKSMEIKPGMKVLEVGVGTGLSLPLYPPFCEITGIDLCESMLKQGSEKIRQYGLGHVQLEQMDATHLDFEDNTFDAVTASMLISVVPEPRKVFGEMIRVCKEGGRIVLLNHFCNGNKLMTRMERFISPLCTRIGFRTDLSLEHLTDGMPLTIHKKVKVNPFRFWHLVQCRKACEEEPARTVVHAG